MAILKSFVLAAGSTATVFAAVPESDFYPIIEYWRAGDFRANQLCQDSVTDASSSVYPTRSSLGLRNFTAQLLDIYDSSAKGKATKDLEYLAQQRRRTNNWESVLTSGLRNAVANARTNAAIDDKGLANAICAQLYDVTPNDFCYAMGNFSQSAQCLSDYSYQNSDQVLADLDPAADFGWSLPDACLAPIASGQDVLDVSLQLHTETPDLIDSSVAAAEGQTYYMLLKALDHLQRFAEYDFVRAQQQAVQDEAGAATGSSASLRILPTLQRKTAQRAMGIHDLFRNEEAFENLLPEWKTERLFMINEPRFMGGPTLRSPFAVLASRNHNLLFALRSPVSTYDARLSLYNQQSFKYLYNFTGEVHDGSATIFQTLSGIFEFAIDEFFEAQDLSDVTGKIQITFTANDLPSAGAAYILASHMQRVLAEKFGSASAVQINVVTFGASYVADAAFVDKIRRVLEIRNVKIVEDSTDMFPCPRTYSCDERVLLPRTGIETGKEYSYAKLPGGVQIPLSSMTKIDSRWGEESAPLQLAAIKDCAYHCYFASKYCPSDPDDRCAKCPSFVH